MEIAVPDASAFDLIEGRISALEILLLAHHLRDANSRMQRLKQLDLSGETTGPGEMGDVPAPEVAAELATFDRKLHQGLSTLDHIVAPGSDPTADALEAILRSGNNDS